MLTNLAYGKLVAREHADADQSLLGGSLRQIFRKNVMGLSISLPFVRRVSRGEIQPVESDWRFSSEFEDRNKLELDVSQTKTLGAMTNAIHDADDPQRVREG